MSNNNDLPNPFEDPVMRMYIYSLGIASVLYLVVVILMIYFS